MNLKCVSGAKHKNRRKIKRFLRNSLRNTDKTAILATVKNIEAGRKCVFMDFIRLDAEQHMLNGRA